MPTSSASAQAPAFTPWWGAYTLPVGHTHHWNVGSLSCWLMRTDREWRVAWETGRDALVETNKHTGPTEASDAGFDWSDPPAAYTVTRYSMRSTHEHLHLQPMLADRSVVIRPEHPISIVSGESITLFISTPLWMHLQVHTPKKHLVEMPTVRPSDTWFGATTLEGELCYAGRTTGRLHLENVPMRPHRAVTPLRIRNQASDTLLLERVQVPTRHLALYATNRSILWTQALTLEREANRMSSDPAATVHVRTGAPEEAQQATLLTEPRETTRRNLFVSTFGAVGSLFGA